MWHNAQRVTSSSAASYGPSSLRVCLLPAPGPQRSGPSQPAPGPQSLSPSSTVPLTHPQARRVAWHHQERASCAGRGRPFPLRSLSCLICDVGPQLLSPGGCRAGKGFGALLSLLPLLWQSSHSAAPEPAAQCPQPPANPDGTMAEPAAPSPGPVDVRAQAERMVRALSPCSQQPPGPLAPYLGRSPLVHAAGVLTAQALLLCQAPGVCGGDSRRLSGGWGPGKGAPQTGAPRLPQGPRASRPEDGWGCLLKPPFKGGQCPFLF